jgi:MFS family permease
VLEPLRHRDFRLLWTGRTVSVFGDFINSVALPFQVLSLGGGPLELGIYGAVRSGASVVFVLLGGVIADRLSRRHIILASDLASGCVIGLVALLSATGELRLPHLYVAAAIFGAASSFFVPAIEALVPEIVPRDVLQAANSPPRAAPARTAPPAGPRRSGIYVLGPVVGPLEIALPILVRDVLRGDARLFGTITAAIGLGQVVAGIALAQLKIRWLGIAICILAAAGGVALSGIGLVTDVPIILVLAAVFGVQFVGVGVLWTTAVQKHVPLELLGRVTSIDFFGGSLLLPLAPVLFAAIVAAVGPAEAFVVGGAISVVIAVLLLLVPSIRALE